MGRSLFGFHGLSMAEESPAQAMRRGLVGSRVPALLSAAAKPNAGKAALCRPNGYVTKHVSVRKQRCTDQESYGDRECGEREGGKDKEQFNQAGSCRQRSIAAHSRSHLSGSCG